MKQFLSQEKLEEIQEIIEMKIVHRYQDRPQVGRSSTGRKIVHRLEDLPLARR